MSQLRFTFVGNVGRSHSTKLYLEVAKNRERGEREVEGVGGDGLEQIIKMYNTPDQFGGMIFDEIAESDDHFPC
jgi:hypothetical protein